MNSRCVLCLSLAVSSDHGALTGFTVTGALSPAGVNAAPVLVPAAGLHSDARTRIDRRLITDQLLSVKHTDESVTCSHVQLICRNADCPFTIFIFMFLCLRYI